VPLLLESDGGIGSGLQGRPLPASGSIDSGQTRCSMGGGTIPANQFSLRGRSAPGSVGRRSLLQGFGNTSGMGPDGLHQVEAPACHPPPPGGENFFGFFFFFFFFPRGGGGPPKKKKKKKPLFFLIGNGGMGSAAAGDFLNPGHFARITSGCGVSPARP